MKNFPLRRNYEMKINIKKKVLFFTKNKTILLKYKEASVLQAIDFIQSEKHIIEYFKDFILDNSNANQDDLLQILLNFDIIWKHLNTTFLKGLNIKNIKNIENKDNEQEGSGGFNAYLILLSEKLNLDPLKILNNYTLTQLNYLTEGIIYNLNEQTEQGQQDNRMNSIKKQRDNLNDTDAQKIKNFIYSP